jgi:hypothetical protein
MLFGHTRWEVVNTYAPKAYRMFIGQTPRVVEGFYLVPYEPMSICPTEQVIALCPSGIPDEQW